MKWPETLTAVRHAQSAFNALKVTKDIDPLYQTFKKSYERAWDSDETYKLALEVRDMFSLGVGDHNTPLSDRAANQARTMASRLRNLIPVPDIIFVSPYARTKETLALMTEKWPQLSCVTIKEEERIREQEHGLALLYNDWRVFNVLNPLQKNLHDLEGSYWYRYPNGENIPDVRERVRSWLTTIVRDFKKGNILAVSHHLTILSLRATLERFDSDEFQRLDHEEKPINCGVTIYRGHPELGEDGRLILDVYNAKLY